MDSIDLNCDMGESYGRFQIGNDEQIFPLISSSNIACGYHGGDPHHLEKTIRLALRHKVQIGAHPSYPDLMGFGRRKMEIPPAELKSMVKYQVAALKGLTESLGGQLKYVKPHGALYNSMARNPREAAAVVEGILEIDSELMIMGLAGSHLQEMIPQMGATFIGEAFADRRYEPDGSLMSRQKPGAVLSDPGQIAEQVLNIVQKKTVVSSAGKEIPIRADSICIHGDNPQVFPILQSITQALAKEQIQVQPFSPKTIPS